MRKSATTKDKDKLQERTLSERGGSSGMRLRKGGGRESSGPSHGLGSETAYAGMGWNSAR